MSKRCTSASLTVVGCLFLAMLIACGGGATSTVQSNSPPATSESSKPEKPTTIEERLARLPDDQQRYARAAIAGSVPSLVPSRMRIGEWGNLPTVEVFQVVNASEVLVKADDELFMLTGVRTSGMVDGRNYSLSDAFEVEGTRRYSTAIGASKQVLSLRIISGRAATAIVNEANQAMLERAVNVARAEAAEQRAAKEKEAADKVAQEVASQEADTAAKRRTWNSADGKFTVEAEFISSGGGKVKLRRLDNGKELSLDANILSPADLAWIKSRGAGKS